METFLKYQSYRMFSRWAENSGICISWPLTSSFYVWYVHRALSQAQVSENTGRAALDRDSWINLLIQGAHHEMDGVRPL